MYTYSEKATNFAKYPPVIWLAVHRTNNSWRFRKILWPSQNIWTLITKQNEMNWQQDKIGLSKLHKILWNVPVNYNGQRLLGTLKQECRKIVIESCQVKICRISWLNLSVKLASEDKVKRRLTLGGRSQTTLTRRGT